MFGFVPGRARESVVEHEDLLRRIETGDESLDLETRGAPAPARHPRTPLLAFQAEHHTHPTHITTES